MTEWGVKIKSGIFTYIEPGMTEEVAHYEFKRWKSFGYNTTGIVYRETSDSEWIEQPLPIVSAEEPEHYRAQAAKDSPEKI